MTTPTRGPGRPAYTAEERIRASRDRIARSILPTKDDCLVSSLNDVAYLEGKRIRPAAFVWRTERADEFQEGDQIRTTCGRPRCVNLDHLVRIKPTLIREAALKQPKAVAVVTEDQLEQLHIMWLRQDPDGEDERTPGRLEWLKQYWRDHPVTEDEAAAEIRMDFFPKDYPEDVDELRILALEYGITVS